MITLTENAKDYLTDMVSKSEDSYAKLSVKGGGCAGFEYKWETTDTTDKGTLIDDILCLLYTSPSPRDLSTSRMPSSA